MIEDLRKKVIDVVLEVKYSPNEFFLIMNKCSF